MRKLIKLILVLAVGPVILSVMMVGFEAAYARTCKGFEGSPSSHCPAEEETSAIECATQDCYKNSTSSDRSFASAASTQRPENVDKVLRALTTGQSPRDEGKSEESDR